MNMFVFGKVAALEGDKTTTGKDRVKITIEQKKDNGGSIFPMMIMYGAQASMFEVGESYVFKVFESKNEWADKRTGEKRSRLDFVVKEFSKSKNGGVSLQDVL